MSNTDNTDAVRLLAFHAPCKQQREEGAPGRRDFLDRQDQTHKERINNVVWREVAETRSVGIDVGRRPGADVA